jgi:hypothetical protein
MQTIKLTVKAWIEQEFPPPSTPPTTQTVRNWIRDKVINGKKIGNIWYVITEPTTGNEEIDQILREIS